MLLLLFLLTTTIFTLFWRQREFRLGELIGQARRENRLCAAAVDAGGIGDGFQLGELAGGEPGESGGHP